MLIETDVDHTIHEACGTLARNGAEAPQHRFSRPLAARAVVAVATLAVGLATQVGSSGPTAHSANVEAGAVAAPLFDPGPSWAPDHGLLCEILERYGNADSDVCPTEPINAIDGPR